MTHCRTWLFTLLITLGCVPLQAQNYHVLPDSIHFSTSYDDNYNIKLHIEDSYVCVDQVPDKPIFQKYMFGIKDAFNLDGRGYKVSPGNGEWLVSKKHKEGRPMRISCKGLEDGLYEVALYVKKRHNDEYWNYTNPFDIVIQVKDKTPVFIGPNHIEQTKAVLSKIPTDQEFLERCVEPTEDMQIDLPVFKQLVEQLTVGDVDTRTLVQRTADWVAYHLILEQTIMSRSGRYINAYTAIKEKETSRNGFAVLTAATLRAMGIPAITAPVLNLYEGSLWYNNKKFRNGRRNIVLAYYDKQWRIVDTLQNNDEYATISETKSSTGYNTIYKGVDMTLNHFCNRSRLIYAYELRWEVESFLRPIDLYEPAIVAMSVDSIDSLPNTHITTSYCKPYAIGMHIQGENQVVVDHLPQLSNFVYWTSIWKNKLGTQKMDKDKYVYDYVNWKINKWKPSIYEFNLYDKDQLGYATKSCIQLKKDATGVQFLDDEATTKKNRQVLKAIPMTAAKRKEMLKHSFYYNTRDAEVIRMAKEITKGMTDDYEKMAAIHQWVSKNIYFDKDVYKTHKDFFKHNKPPVVLKTRKSIGNGYAYLACSMMRAVGIPAVGLLNKLKRKAPGASGHVILIAYYKGRWVIMDPASDSWNKFENGTFQPQLSTPNRMLYFDSSLAYMSRFREFEKPLDHGFTAKVKVQRKRYVTRKVVRKKS